MKFSAYKTCCADAHVCNDNAAFSCCAFSDMEIIMDIALIAMSIFLILRLSVLVLIPVLSLIALLIPARLTKTTERDPLIHPLPNAA